MGSMWRLLFKIKMLKASSVSITVEQFYFIINCLQRNSESPSKSGDRYRPVDTEVLLNLQKDIRPPSPVEEDRKPAVAALPSLIPVPVQPASGKIPAKPAAKFREFPR